MLPGRLAEHIEARYGSAQNGLLCGFLFDAGGPGRSVGADEGMALLNAGASGRFLWLHFNLANIASRRWMKERLALPEAFEASFEHRWSTRLEIVGAAVIAVMNDVQLYGFDASDASSIVLYVDEQLLVSARQSPLRSVDRLRESVIAGERFRSPMELLAHLLRDQADILIQIVRDATAEVDHIEDWLLSGHLTTVRAKLGALRRTLVRLQRLLAPEPAALFRLLNRPPSWIAREDVQDLRLSAEELVAAVADCTALGERVRLLQEEMIASVNEQTNHTLFVLTVVTVLALPMTIIPGLFGMNVGGVPLSESTAGFWVIAAIALIVPATAGFLILKGRGRF